MKIKKKMKKARKRSRKLFIEAAELLKSGNKEATEIAMTAGIINHFFGRRPILESLCFIDAAAEKEKSS